MGESASDFLVHSMAPVLAVLLGFVGFCVALSIQLRADRYLAWAYWFAVAMVGVFGTMAADVLHVGFGVPYTASSVLFAIVLGAVFLLWHRVEGTLSIHSVYTLRRELFYWAAVVATFAMGTAVGDLTAATLGWGYFTSAVIFGVLLVLPGIGYWRFGLNAVAAFWISYVLTRPFGASVADYLGVSHKRGGLDLGPGPVSLALALLIVACVAYLARTKIDVPRPAVARPGELTSVD
jgi:uncharacterized membrane-anchored protein